MPQIRSPKRGVLEHRDVVGALEVRAEGDASKRVFRLSDDTVDRYNSIIAFDGWKLDGFRANPVMLFGHSYWGFPIGHWGDVEQDTKSRALYASPAVWAPTEEAQTTKALVEAGILRACSVGFDPISWTFDEKRGGVNYLEQELLEVSIVTVPGNANALAEGRAAGIEVRSILDHVERSIRMVRGVDPKRAAELEQLARLGEAPKVYSFARTVGGKREEFTAPTPDELRTLAGITTRDDEGTLCPGCQTRMPADAKFCSACGTAMKTEEKAAEPAPVEEKAFVLDVAALEAAVREATKPA